LPLSLQKNQEICHTQGHSLVVVAVDQTVCGALEMLPTLRPEAKEIVNQLRSKYADSIYIISGVDNYFAETLPEHKADLITQLQEEGKFVCYIGDGINDSIALKKAQVSASLLIAEKFDANLKKTLKVSMVPATIIVGGAFFLHLSLIHSIFINAVGFGTGFFNTMLPRMKHQSQNKDEISEVSHPIIEVVPTPDKARLGTALYSQ